MMTRSDLVTRVTQKLGFDLPEDERAESGRAKFVGREIPKGGIGAEVGVHKGRFTQVLLDEAQPKRLHLIDPWYLLGERWGWGPGNRSTITALTRILKRYTPQLVDGTLVLHIGDDLEVLQEFEPGYFDWLYIDTTHEYDQTVRELELAQRLIKPDGVICGDDWRDDPTHPHYGVNRAVTELCAKAEFRLTYSSAQDRQWSIRRAG